MNNMINSDKGFIDLLINLMNFTENNKNFIADDIICNLQDLSRTIINNISQEKNKNRLLKIGIVGTVKAGKSSFLNSLIFEGKDVLPKAATPMTASLTKISYGEVPEAKIVFYKSYDWGYIKKRAEEYYNKIEENYKLEKEEWNKEHSKQEFSKKDINSEPTREKIEKKVKNTLPEAMVACAELVNMVKINGVNVNEILDTERCIQGSKNETFGNYINLLNDYVSANGKFTPLVNYIELKINNDLLKEIEVVDTPGLDDPIRSRVEKTKDFLNVCDVVFLVSNVSQFITAKDVNLVVNNFFKKGIKNIYIVGSQIDSGILQYKAGKDIDIENAIEDSLKNYKRHVNNIINDLENVDKEIVKSLKINKPLFVSSMIYNIAKKIEQKEKFNEEEDFAYNNLKNRFKNFDEIFETTKDLYSFAGIDKIKEEVYADIKKQKAEIIDERIKNYTLHKKQEVLELLEKANINIVQRRDEIETSSEQKLSEKLVIYNEKLNSMRYDVRELFQTKLIEIKTALEKLKRELISIAANKNDLKVYIEKEMHKDVHKSWFGLKKTVERYIVDVKCANVSEAEDAVFNFTKVAEEEINEVLKDLFGKDYGRKDFENKLKKLIEETIDFSNKDFNRQEVLMPIEEVLNAFSYKTLDIDFTNEIQEYFRNKFPYARITDNEIHELKRALHDQKILMMNKLSKEVDEYKDNIELKFNNLSSTFIDKLQIKIQTDINKTIELLNNKKANIKKCQELIDDIKIFKRYIEEI